MPFGTLIKERVVFKDAVKNERINGLNQKS